MLKAEKIYIFCLNPNLKPCLAEFSDSDILWAFSDCHTLMKL